MSAPVIFELRGKRVFVAGHAGMVGAAIMRRLEREHCDLLVATRQEVDLRHPQAIERFMAQTKPDAVFLAAGKVGGIRANSTYPPRNLSPTISRSRLTPFTPPIRAG
jgi:GDP-L-fucose synthase